MFPGGGRMNILDLLRSRGLTPRLVSSAKPGGEYQCGCPICGNGVDGSGRGADGSPSNRFHALPEQEGGPACQAAGVRGTFWCRNCGAAGDMLELVMLACNLTFAAACQELKVPRKARSLGLPKPPKSAAPPAFVPQAWPLPSDTWRERAARLVDKCHERLVSGPNKALDWLAARGLDLDAVRRYRLGYLIEEPNKAGNSTGIFRARSAWDLPPQEKKNQDGSLSIKRSLWIPRGIVIPAYEQGAYTEGALPFRIRIRRPDKDVEGTDFPKYHVIPGSGMAPLLLGASARAFVVVEAELDAMLVHHLAGDKVGALAVMTNLGKPDARAHQVLSRALTVLVALDYDKAGAAGWAWWQEHCPTAKRWPVPAGKDPGDAFAQGEDLRAWALAGLPPVLAREPHQLPAPAPAPSTAPLGPSLDGEAAPQGEGEATPQAAAPAPQARQDAPQPPRPAVTLTPALRRALDALARFMSRHAITWGQSSRGHRAWLFPAHLTEAMIYALFDALLPLVPPDVHDLVRAHPAQLVTAENLCAPYFATHANR